MKHSSIHTVRRAAFTSLTGLVLAATPVTHAQAAPDAVGVPQEATDESELAKQTQNPISDLLSVLFQNNINFAVGPENATQYGLNIQPAVPI